MSAHPETTADAIDVPATEGSSARRRSGRGRSIAAAACGVLAIVALTVTTVAVWARETVSDSREVAQIVGDALAEREVEAALSTYITDQIFAAVDVEAALEEVVPAQLQRLSPVLNAGARTAVERSVSRLLANPDVQEVVRTLVERAHGRALRLLQGDGMLDGVSVSDGEVTVNLLPLIGRGAARLQELGLFEDLEVPELTADGDPAEQIAQLSATIGRELPDDFGQLVVYRSDDLAQRQESLERAQQVVALSKRALWALAVLTVVATAASVLLAHDRGRAALLLGLAAAASMVVIRSAVRLVGEDAPDLARTPGGRAAIDAIVGGASTGLLRTAGVVMLVAAAVVLLSLLARDWRRADLVAVAAVAAFAGAVAVLGLGLVGLLVGLVALVMIPVLARRPA